MSYRVINIGSGEGAGDGDSIRLAFEKSNSNFEGADNRLQVLETGVVRADGTVTGNIVPDTDVTYDLGSSSKKFKDLYLSGNTITLGNQTISSSASGINTSGNFTTTGTIQATTITSTAPSNLSGSFTGDLKGSVYSDGSATMIDGVAGLILGDVRNTYVETGNIILSGNTIGSSSGDLNVAPTGSVNITTGLSVQGHADLLTANFGPPGLEYATIDSISLKVNKIDGPISGLPGAVLGISSGTGMELRSAGTIDIEGDGGILLTGGEVTPGAGPSDVVITGGPISMNGGLVINCDDVTFNSGSGTVDFGFTTVDFSSATVNGLPATTTINNNADNRIITGSATANTLNAETGITFNNNRLLITSAGGVDCVSINANNVGNNEFLSLRGGSVTGGIKLQYYNSGWQDAILIDQATSVMQFDIPIDANGNNVTGVATLNGLTIPGGTGTLAMIDDIPTDISQLTDSTNLIPPAYTDLDVDAHLNTGTATASQLLSWTGSDYDWVDPAVGIALTDLSIGAEASASGDGGIAYDNSTGVFTYTPPDLSGYQTTLVSGTNIKTLNNSSLLGSGNIDIEAYSDDKVNLLLGTDPTLGGVTTGYILSYDNSEPIQKYQWIPQSGGGGGEIALSGTNLYSSNLTNFGNTISSGTGNVVMGDAAGNAITTGNDNVALGTGALQTITTRYGNVALGRFALGFSSSTNLCTAVGNGALISNNGEYNVGIGASAMGGNVSGDYNVAVGAGSGTNVSGSAERNVYIGGQAGNFAGTSGYSPQKNVYIGSLAGQHFEQSSYCTIIGADTGGASSGNAATGDNNTCLGYQASLSSISVSNEITLGNSSITTLRCNTQSITSLSDARDKKDVEDLSLGLNFVEKLRPVAFTWNMRDGGKVDQPDTGFIAQELQQAQEDEGVVLPGLVYATNPEKLEASYGKLIPSLVKSIQELSSQVKELQQQIKDIKDA